MSDEKKNREWTGGIKMPDEEQQKSDHIKEATEIANKLNDQLMGILGEVKPQMKFSLVSANGPDMLDSERERTILDYRPTKYELLQLVRHWAGVYIEEKSDMAGPMGFEPMRLSRACQGLQDLQKVLGEAEINRILEEEIEIAGRSWDYEEWGAIFGTEEERKTWHEKEASQPIPDECIFAVPAHWTSGSWENPALAKCNLHHLGGEILEDPRSAFRLMYGPWTCPDCGTQVRFALRIQGDDEGKVLISNMHFDTRRTAELLKAICPPRTKRRKRAA